MARVSTLIQPNKSFVPRDYHSLENGKMMSRSVESSFTETVANTRESYIMKCLMAKESIIRQAERSTRETFKMAFYTDLESKLGQMGLKKKAAITRVRFLK